MPLAALEVTELTLGAVVSMTMVFLGDSELPAPRVGRVKLALLVPPARPVWIMVPPLRLRAGAGVVQGRRRLAAADRVGEDQGRAAGAAAVTGAAAAVEGEFGRAGDGHGRAEADGDAEDRAEAVGAAGGASGNGADAGCRGVDDDGFARRQRTAGSQGRQGQGGVGGAAGLEDGAAVETQGAGAGVVQGRRRVAGADRVGKDQGFAARTAAVTGRAAAVEGEFGRAGDGYRRAKLTVMLKTAPIP